MRQRRVNNPAAGVTPLRGEVVPRYRQVEAILRDQIWLGELQPGDQLPTEQELCRRFAVSRATVRQALSNLEQDRLIYKEVARGTFVSPHVDRPQRSLVAITPDKLLSMDSFDEIALKRTGAYVARGDVQSALGLTAGSDVFFFLRVYYFDGEPVGGEQVYVAPTTASRLSEEDMAWPRITSRISERTERPLGDVEFRLGAITADARHSLRFETFSGAPLISILRTTFDASQCPLEHGHILLRSDRCQITFKNP